MIEVPEIFKQEINTIYPYENYIIFEAWIALKNLPETKREYLPINFTSYFVNNKYGTDKEALQRLQNFINELPTDKKYWAICQYDDGILVDTSRIDLLVFNMSKKTGVEMPLLNMPHSYKHDGAKNIMASFIGSHTHPIRENVFRLNDNIGYYISDIQHGVVDFCKVLASSVFGLCPRGYGLNSFRICECMQYGTVPVYISDNFVNCFDIDFSEYGVLVPESESHDIVRILKSYTPLQIVDMQDKISEVYKEYYTYEGALNKIIKYLESEHNS